MTELPIQQILFEAIAVLEKVGVPYAVMGGFAARAWGLPRPTYDADIAVVVDGDGLQRLFDALERSGFDVPQEHRTGFLDVVAGFRKAKVNYFQDGHVWHADLFVVHGEFLNEAFQRARRTNIGGKELTAFSPEDLIILKLIAFRKKDQADIEDILHLCRGLDVEYLQRWAKRFDLTARLDEFIH